VAWGRGAFLFGQAVARAARSRVMGKRHVVIIGGGAAGFFAAIACAEASPDCAVTLYEATAHPLAKVKVSGGGRCNVTHACFDPRELVKRYPRGGRELLGAFHRWQPRDTVAWFEARGVALKTEEDGRMFPVTDSSQTIVDCLEGAAARAGVKIVLRTGMKSVSRAVGGFQISLTTGETVTAARVLLATGGNKSNAGLTIAEQFGHTIEPPVPSLFTFHIDDPRLKDLAGVSVENAVTTVPGTALKERGPLLVTHWGLSGPAVLKLSAWGARILHDREYKFTLGVNWAPAFNAESLRAEWERARTSNPKKQLATWCPVALPLRLWEKLLPAAGLEPDSTWTTAPGAGLRELAAQITEGKFVVTGKSTFKEEFVTCGGVRLSEIDFKTMESRRVPGLHFAGEVIDVDGVTGGFNFQAAWTGGHLAGCAMAGKPVA
jgi:predicted Rossmann fold flavoprotein